ncbi:glutamyl-tRNA(Gln) amidotransferase subunit A [Roseibium sp. TrichSKD4]|nr:glutamyl-tRNA(Gln) amidotransferase subunit A [Roseibium sp. TrichSKD4]
MTVSYAFKDVRTLKSDLSGGAITPGELVSYFASRIQKLNDLSRAFITITADAAADEANRLSPEDLTASPFSGIPYACKDLFDVEGVPTTAGSKVFHDRIGDRDAFAIAQLRAAGAVCLGKTNLHEFAYGATGENEVYGTCVNAYDTTRLAGGSSSGSAAAVAFGLAPAALRTDTGGSVRAPAVLNVLVGLKPTLDLVSTRGVVPYCWTLDHVGLITRTIADCADFLDVLTTTRSHAEALNQPIKGLRIGIPTHFFQERTDRRFWPHWKRSKNTSQHKGPFWCR